VTDEWWQDQNFLFHLEDFWNKTNCPGFESNLEMNDDRRTWISSTLFVMQRILHLCLFKLMVEGDR
jgi:hypothetical protein